MFRPEKDDLAKVTINGFIVKTNFHFRVVDVWPLGRSSYVFFDRVMSEPAQELFNRLSMWGGESKIHPDIEGARGWEFEAEVMPMIQRIIDRTRHTRPEDVCR